jgi:hypothetical protein
MAVAAPYLIVVAVGFFLVYWPEFKLQRDAKSLMSQSEAAALTKMGPPHAVVTAAAIAAHPSEAWWGSSWSPAPTRPVTNKVLLYYAVFTGALVYISPGGLVEHVHIVGT